MNNLIKTFGLDKLHLTQEGIDIFSARLDDLPVAIYAADMNGNIIFYNKAAVSLWGRAPIIGHDKWSADYDLYTTDGKYIPRDNCAMAMAVKKEKALRGVEAAAMRPDGTAFRFLPFPTPLHDQYGVLIGAVNMIVYLGEVSLPVQEPEIDFQSACHTEHASASL